MSWSLNSVKSGTQTMSPSGFRRGPGRRGSFRSSLKVGAFAAPQVHGRIVRVGLGVDLVGLGKRESWDVALGAADFGKEALAFGHGGVIG